MKRLMSVFFVLTLLLSLSVMFVPKAAKASQTDFVTRSDRFFMLNGEKFYYGGDNLYYLGLTPDQTRVNNILAAEQAKGIKVMRIWAFNNRAEDGIQTSLGVYNETNFKQLDYALSRARVYGIRLIMTMVNNWNDYNGMQWYVDSRLGTGQPQYKFYSDTAVKQDFKNYISTMLNRTNTYTGVKYKDDPYVFAWELANEPRNQSLTTNDNGDMMLNWINEMGAFIKGIDPNHMLATGEEGFKYGGTGGGEPDAGGDNVDFNRNIMSPYIDFGTIHVYPQNWGARDDAWVNYYLTDRANIAHNTAHKPMIVEEYGVETSDTAYGGRDARFTNWHNYAIGADYDGIMVWQMEDFTNSSFSFDFGTSSAVLIQNMAAVQNSKSGSTTSPTQGTIDLSNTSTSGSSFGRNDTDQKKRYETFTATNLSQITSLDLRIKADNGVPSNLVVELYNTSGNMPTGSPLASAQVAGSSIPTSFGTVNVPLTYSGLVNGTKYAVVVTQATLSNTSFYEWAVAAGSSSNQFGKYTTTWVDDSAVGDGSLKIYVSGSSAPTSGSIDLSNTSTNGSSFGRNDSDQKRRYETFTAGNLPKITSVDLRLKADGGVPSNLTVELYNTNGNMPTGSPLASVQVAGSSIPASFGTVNVPLTFNSLVSGTKYAIAVSQVTLSNSTFYEWAVATGSSANDFGKYTTTWVDDSASGDGSVKINVSN